MGKAIEPVFGRARAASVDVDDVHFTERNESAVALNDLSQDR